MSLESRSGRRGEETWKKCVRNGCLCTLHCEISNSRLDFMLSCICLSFLVDIFRVDSFLLQNFQSTETESIIVSLNESRIVRSSVLA